MAKKLLLAKNVMGFVFLRQTVLVLLAGVFFLPQISHAIEIRDIRIGVHGEATRFVIELDQAVPFRIFTLNTPERLIIDLPESKFTVSSTPDLVGTVIDKYRTGLFRPGVNRIVLDLVSAVEIVRHDSLTGGGKFRIFIDIVPIKQAKSRRMDFASSDWKSHINQQEIFDKSQAKKSQAKKSQEKAKAAKEKRKIIVIDPGHGGVDPGGVVPGIKEKTIVLSFAKLLQKKIEATGKYRAILTRKRDIHVALRERFKIADKVDADLFISIHADKIHVSSIRGLTIYTLSEKASDAESATLAQQANRSDVIVGQDLSEYTENVSNILIEFAQERTNRESWRLAKLMVKNLKGQVPISVRAHRYAGFAVLKSPNVPSILLELGYLTNKSDLKNLRSRNFKSKVADRMIKGIEDYFKEVAS